MAERGSVFLRLFVLGYWVVAVGSLDGGCVEAWGYPRATATVASAALAVAVVAGIVCYLRNVDVLVSLAVAVTVWLVTTGVGNSAVWYRIGGIYVRRMWLTIGLPLLEMAALAGLAAALLNPLRVHRAAGLLSLLIVAGALVGYGWLRMFAASERRGLVLRMKGFMSGGEGW
jgi:hypothetical protein